MQPIFIHQLQFSILLISVCGQASLGALGHGNDWAFLPLEKVAFREGSQEVREGGSCFE